MGVGTREGDRGPGSLELTVEALAAGGRGVARVDGRVWFVPGTVPGDVVLARPERERARYVEALPVRPPCRPTFAISTWTVPPTR